jgi:NAD(P)-dependent dehydrogenase (short-subunit alcohol dehydrogenase family)
VPLSITFDADRHARFVALSGDLNPMHVDAVAARRTQAGAPVVHGIHTLLWLLDCVAEKLEVMPQVATLTARFHNMVYVGERADAEVLQLGASALRARVTVDGVDVLSLILGLGAPGRNDEPPLPFVAASEPPPSLPIDLRLDQMGGRSGRLRFAAGPAEVAAMFPHAARLLGPQRIAALTCTSCVVGMVVPGLHSILGGVELGVDENNGVEDLTYAVTSVNSRFRLVHVAVRGGGLRGVLKCASRPPPVAQPDMAAVVASVAKDEFLGTPALVVGGSRGLGETTAKLLAAGGGRVTITYKSGAADAEAVARDIRSRGGLCDFVPYDVRQRAAPQLAVLSQAPTQVYYFATPTIARRKAGLCDPRRLEELNAYYVTGFFDLVTACMRLRPEGVHVFYPSTVYVEQRPADFTEYAMAKSAGEILCADMQRFWRGLHVLVRRLPRTLTDQTGSLLPNETADPLQVMLPIVREMHQRAPSLAES